MSQEDVVASRRQLDAFLVDNVEFEQLTARLSSFNIFKVLDIERAENGERLPGICSHTEGEGTS